MALSELRSHGGENDVRGSLRPTSACAVPNAEMETCCGSHRTEGSRMPSSAGEAIPFRSLLKEKGHRQNRSEHIASRQRHHLRVSKPLKSTTITFDRGTSRCGLSFKGRMFIAQNRSSNRHHGHACAPTRGNGANGEFVVLF